MEAANLQIYWHESQPVYSLTFPPKSQYDPQLPKLFTAGGDNKIRIWNLNTVKSSTNDSCSKIDTIDFLTSLQQHEQAINVIRFNSKGDILASAGDDGQILLWKRNKDGEKAKPLPFGTVEEESSQKDNNESWFVWKRLRFHSHASEIYDLSWSPCDNYILCGCMDNFIRIFHIKEDEDEMEPKCIMSLKEHNHYVQGVTWDPQNKYILSQSTDRSINIYKLIFNTDGTLIDLTLQNKIIKFEKSYMFHNETLPSFFRRLTISPCGNLIMIPTGLSKVSNDTTTNCVYIFARSSLNDNFNKPIVKLSNLKKPALIISFNSIFYKLTSQSSNFISLPYKLVFAVATSNEILIYDTESVEPLAIIGNLHYTPMTDLAWSPDGSFLMISSTDGFCSYISIDNSLFGFELTTAEVIEMKQNQLKPNLTEPVKKEKSNALSSQKVTPKKDIINILPVKKKEKLISMGSSPIKISSKQDIVNILPVKKKEKVNISSPEKVTPKHDIVNILPVKKKIKHTVKRAIVEKTSDSNTIATTAVQSSLPIIPISESAAKRQKIPVSLKFDPIEEDSS
ncbi:chromatin assembly factor 1 subunit p60 [Monosporozyma unispora]|nr:hypothetical protein C6P44_003049 [Kazachstania unispora]